VHGPSLVLLSFKYERTACIGQTVLSVAPMYTAQSLTASGKVVVNRDLLCYRPQHREMIDSRRGHEPAEGIVNLLTRRKPKKAVQHIAQNVVWSYEGVSFENAILMLYRIGMVIGKRGIVKCIPACRSLTLILVEADG